MKITHIITSLDKGGAEKNLFNILKASKKKNLVVSVINLREGGYFSKKISNELNYQVYNLSLNKNIVLGLFKFLIHVLNNNYTHVQGWMYHGNLFSIFLKILKPNIKVFWNIRQTLYGINKEKFNTRLVIRANKFLSKIPKKIFVNSQVSKMQHLKFGFSDNFRLVSNIVSKDEFYYKKDFFNDFRKEFNLKPSYFCIGLFQRNHPMKNITLFINTCFEIIKVYHYVRFFIFGKSTLELKNLINSQNQENFIFEENYTNINKAICGMNIVVNTSSWGEGLSNNLIESYFCNTKFITSNIGDNKKLAILTNNEFFQADSIKELKSLIVKNINKFKSSKIKELNMIDKKILNQFDAVEILEIYINEYEL